MYINKSLIYGNLTRDPELKSLPSGSAVCNFSIATNRKWKDKSGKPQEDVQYHNIVCFGKTAEIVHSFMRKGSGLFIEGRLQTRSWEQKDGTKRYITEIVAEQVQFGPKRQDQSRVDDVSTETIHDVAGEINAESEEISPEDLPF